MARKRLAAVVVLLTFILFAGIIGARLAVQRTAAQAQKAMPGDASPQFAEGEVKDEQKESVRAKASKDEKPLPVQKPAPKVKPESTPEAGGASFGLSEGEDEESFDSEEKVKACSDQLNLSDSQKLRVAAWADWKSKTIEALTETQRNDRNKLREIDTAYRNGVMSELDQTQAGKLKQFFSE